MKWVLGGFKDLRTAKKAVRLVKTQKVCVSYTSDVRLVDRLHEELSIKKNPKIHPTENKKTSMELNGELSKKYT